MALQTDKKPSVLRSLDWWTILIYMALLCFGWMSVCGASYTYGVPIGGLIMEQYINGKLSPASEAKAEAFQNRHIAYGSTDR